jgi:coatomer subunit zeta
LDITHDTMQFTIHTHIYHLYIQSGLPPLIPKVDAILVLDGDGNRLAGKYYGDFLKAVVGDKSAEELRVQFEKQVHSKVAGIAARPDAAEVITCQGRTVVFCGGSMTGTGNSDVRVVHVGPPNESELVLAYLCEGMYDALSQLMGGSTDRNMVMDNLELVFLLIDEHCDGGIIMEVDGHKLASAVLLRDDDGMAGGDGGGGGGGMPHAVGPTGMPGGGMNAGEMTIGQALRQARDQFMTGMTSRDGM